jgi:hypothetical protein
MFFSYGSGQQQHRQRGKNEGESLMILIAITGCRHRVSACVISPRRLPWLTIPQ